MAAYHMAERPISAASLVSEIGDQFDRIQLREQYELDSVTRLPSTVALTDQPVADQEHLLHGQTTNGNVELRYFTWRHQHSCTN